MILFSLCLRAAVEFPMERHAMRLCNTTHRQQRMAAGPACSGAWLLVLHEAGHGCWSCMKRGVAAGPACSGAWLLAMQAAGMAAGYAGIGAWLLAMKAAGHGC